MLYHCTNGYCLHWSTVASEELLTEMTSSVHFTFHPRLPILSLQSFTILGVQYNRYMYMSQWVHVRATQWQTVTICIFSTWAEKYFRGNWWMKTSYKFQLHHDFINSYWRWCTKIDEVQIYQAEIFSISNLSACIKNTWGKRQAWIYGRVNIKHHQS